MGKGESILPSIMLTRHGQTSSVVCRLCQSGMLVHYTDTQKLICASESQYKPCFSPTVTVSVVLGGIGHHCT